VSHDTLAPQCISNVCYFAASRRAH
jgi:hypothetical protein